MLHNAVDTSIPNIRLNVAGADRTGQALTRSTDGSARGMHSQSWIVTGVAPGTVTFKLRGQLNAAGDWTAIATHTRFNVVLLAGPQGPQGIQGPAGTSYPPISQEYNFASASTSWVINHNLNTKLIEVSAFDPSGVYEYEVEIEYTNANTVTLRWYNATAGIARIVG